MIDPLTDRMMQRGSQLAAPPENRLAPRSSCQPTVTATVVSPDGAEITPVWVRDLSATGIGLVLPRQFDAGTILTVQLHNGRQFRAPRLPVRVIHADIELPHEAWLHGCAFLHPLDAHVIQHLSTD
ncbi:MAG TPA: PilZ domain-containing protein [Gemmataceae bacterium]|nr:PilZ domain-containing protein [Gemmataceae bacterium]